MKRMFCNYRLCALRSVRELDARRHRGARARRQRARRRRARTLGEGGRHRSCMQVKLYT